MAVVHLCLFLEEVRKAGTAVGRDARIREPGSGAAWEHMRIPGAGLHELFNRTQARPGHGGECGVCSWPEPKQGVAGDQLQEGVYCRSQSQAGLQGHRATKCDYAVSTQHGQAGLMEAILLF